MNKKLRLWLESRCHPRSNGAWLVEAPVVQTALAPAFVLPDGAAKEAYLTQAVRLGRFHLIGDCATLTVSLFFVAGMRLVFASAPSDLLDAAVFALLVLALTPLLWRVVARSADRNVWRWLEGLAIATSPAPEDRRAEIRLCRPGWMVAGEAFLYCT